MSEVNDAPETDGCEEDFTVDPDDDETANMRALFPGDTSSTKEQWEELFPTEQVEGGGDAS